MQNLVTLKSDLSNFSITSLEVAEMVEKEHNKLLRDIRRYDKQLSEAKIGQSEFWEETFYKNDRGKEYPCYNITKMGCEFIAHKMTGVKGTLFTAQYIKRFHEMEQALKNSKPEINASGVRMISCSPVPKVSEWYMRNRNRISAICKYADMERKELYHQILTFCSEKYDLNAAKKIYKKERGFTPTYAIDIVGYFPELANMADYYLNCVEDSLGMTEEDYDC